MVGHGQVAPVSAKIEAIAKFPVPEDKKGLMRFLGMAGYYRKFCHHFSSLDEPSTALFNRVALIKKFTIVPITDVSASKISNLILMTDI